MSLTVRTWGDPFSLVSSTSDACVDDLRVQLLMENLRNLVVFLTSNVKSFLVLYNAGEWVGKEKAGRWIDCCNKKGMKACSFAL